MSGRNAPRRAAQRDAVEPEIVDALRAVGCKVLVSYDGCWDLVVHSPFLHDRIGRPRWGLCLLEVKMPGGRVRRSQEMAIADGWPIDIVTTIDEALEAVGCKQGSAA